MNKLIFKTLVLVCFIAQPAHAMGPMGPAIRSRAVIEADMDAVADQALAAAREIRERKHAINMPFLLANELPVCLDNLGNQSPDSYVDIIAGYACDLPFNPTQERKRLFAQAHVDDEEERKEHGDAQEERKDEEDQKHKGDPDPFMHNAPVGQRLEAQRALADAEQRLAQHEEKMEALVAERNHVEEHARRLEEAIRQELERLAQIERDRLDRENHRQEDIRARHAAWERHNAQFNSILSHFITSSITLVSTIASPLLITKLCDKNFFSYEKLPDASLTKAQLFKKRLFLSCFKAFPTQMLFFLYGYCLFIFHACSDSHSLHNRYIVNSIKAHGYYMLFDLLQRYGSDLFVNKTDHQESESLFLTTVPSDVALKKKLSWRDCFKYYSPWVIKTAAAAYLAHQQI